MTNHTPATSARKLSASVSLATPEGGCIDAFGGSDDELGDVLLFALGVDRGDHAGRSPALAAALSALDAIARRLDVLSRAADTVCMDAVILTQMDEIERYACVARIIAERLDAAERAGSDVEVADEAAE